MLSVACHESLPPPPAEPAPVVYSFRRLAVAFENDDRQVRNGRRPRRRVPTVSVPAYSRIVFRAGTVSVR
jgi:hypothetical protein